MEGESVLFVRPADGGPATAQLLFTPTAMPRLQSATEEIEYEPGRDFLWEAGSHTLSIPAGSRVPVMNEADLYPPRGSQKFGTCRDQECDLLFAEGMEFHHRQAVATYHHERDGWHTPETLRELHHLPNLSRRLAGGGKDEPVRIVLLGDSISTGANASGRYQTPPGNLGYGPLLAEQIGKQFGVSYTFTNLSVGGKDSAWGVEQMPQAVAARPDLLVIAFGMNDASIKRPPREFRGIIEEHLAILHRDSPQSNCLLVCTMTGNPQWTGTDMEAYPLYRDELLSLRQDGVVVADVTSVWLNMLSRKKYVDLTGNGLNHPNDFGHRVYAQTAWWILHQALETSAA
jgi:hypothetical protein